MYPNSYEQVKSLSLNYKLNVKEMYNSTNPTYLSRTLP